MAPRGMATGREAKGRSRKGAKPTMAIEVGRRLLLTRLALNRLGKAPRAQQDFAKSVGISKTGYSNYENGIRLIGPDSAGKIYSRYGVSLNWLYLGVVDELPATLHDAIAAVHAELD
jgi:transcriptional regulator with XRE-family HTH domain